VRNKLLLAALVLTALVPLLSPPAASACMGDCYLVEVGGQYYIICFSSYRENGVIPGGITTITRTGPDTARISVSSYSTAQMSIAYECAVAFPRVDGVERIDRLAMVEDATNREMREYVWEQNNASVFDFSRMAEDVGVARAEEWQGFHTSLKNGSLGGVQHSFAFDVKLRPGMTLTQLAENLRTQGVMAHGSATPEGAIDYSGHYFLRRLGDGMIFVNERAPRGDRPPRQN
jgi:hypothetical protein